MNCWKLWFITLTCSLIHLLTFGQAQTLPQFEIYAETKRIVEYGEKILESIKNYKLEKGNIINEWTNIGSKLDIDEVMSRVPFSILERYTCGHETGLDYVKAMLQYFDDWYNEFEKYLSKENDVNSHNEIIENITAMHDLGRLDDAVYFGSSWYIVEDPYTYHELFQFMVDLYKPMTGTSCNSVQSLNQYIYNLLNRILYGYVKIYSIVIYSYINRLLKMTNATVDQLTPKNVKEKQFLIDGLKQAVDDYICQINKTTNNALKVIGRSSRDILSRDPSEHVKGETYGTLDYFIQEYVSSQKYLRDDGICRPSCAAVKNTTHHNHGHENLFPKKMICTGHIRDCKETVVDKICLAPLESTRRYDGLTKIPTQGRSLQYWGRVSETCTIRKSTPVWITGRMCNICSCTCDMIDSPKSIRYIDLQPRQSKLEDSFVITGTRFRIINRILYLQIQEGKLKDGKIIPESVIWRDIERTDRNHDEDKDLFKLDYDNRLIDLIDLTLPSNYVVTMAKFEVKDNIVGLKIEGFPMNHGNLDTSVLLKLSNESIGTLRSKPVINLNIRDLPTRGINENTQISEPNKFLLKFETSDWVSDAGQNVVPFIDFRDVYTDPPTPIAGIGVYIRYGDTSGGFVAPKLISMDNAVKLFRYTTGNAGASDIRRRFLRFG